MVSLVRSLRWLPLAVLAGSMLRAQTVPATEPVASTAQAAPEDPLPPIATLHVYMDLIQVPVLVLDYDLQRLKPIDPSRFSVSLDSGPQFRPKHVRQEGDDPITLGILLDPNSEPDLMPQIGAAISALAPGSLQSRDHVTIFALDCSLRQPLSDVPADAATLKDGADRALDLWIARRKAKHPPPCQNPMQLWDAMALAMKDLAQLPGRRVLIAMTNGFDGGSSMPWADLKEFAQLRSIAVFGVKSNSPGMPAMMGSRKSPDASHEDPFSAICQLSGGAILRADYFAVDRGLAHIMTLVRERYIIEFARARNDSPGHHTIDIKIAKNSDAYIRPAGVTILMAPKEVTEDPSTIPRDTTDAPVIGDRKILSKKNGPP